MKLQKRALVAVRGEPAENIALMLVAFNIVRLKIVILTVKSIFFNLPQLALS